MFAYSYRNMLQNEQKLPQNVPNRERREPKIYAKFLRDKPPPPSPK